MYGYVIIMFSESSGLMYTYYLYINYIAECCNWMICLQLVWVSCSCKSHLPAVFKKLFLFIYLFFICRQSGRYVKTLWKHVRVGDIVHLSCNEVIPADILVLRSSDEQGLCYIETANLDGETNLKQRQVVRGYAQHVSQCSTCKRQHLALQLCVFNNMNTVLHTKGALSKGNCSSFFICGCLQNLHITRSKPWTS